LFEASDVEDDSESESDDDESGELRVGKGLSLEGAR
jgi:hypothetical protein